MTDVRIHLQPEYQYGTLDWINCTANTIDGSTAALSLEVCHNETTFIPIENISSSVPIEDVSLTKNENCSVQKILSHNLVFNKQMNVSFRCRVDDDYNEAPLTSNCIMPNISPAYGRILFLELSTYERPITCLYRSSIVNTVHSCAVLLIVSNISQCSQLSLIVCRNCIFQINIRSVAKISC